MFLGKMINSVKSKLPAFNKGEDNPEESDELDEIVAGIAAADVSAESKEAIPAGNGGNKDMDRFFTKMNSTPQPLEVEASVKDILAVAPGEEKPGMEEKAKAAEKPKEPAAKPVEDNKGKGGFMSDLFEQDEPEENSAMVNLIASIPDIAVADLIGGANEVMALISERKAKEKGNK